MAGVNKAILIGHLGQDPEVKALPNGKSVCNFSLATSESWKDKNGQKTEKTEWHRIVMFGKVADICGQYLQKGSQIYIEGKLQTRNWEDKEGNKRYTTEIVGYTMQMLSSSRQTGQQPQDNSSNQGSLQNNNQQQYGGDIDIPF